MNEKSILMKNEIRIISKYRALILSKYYLTVILSLTSLYLIMIRFAVSSLYILLMLNILPPIFTFALKDYSQKQRSKLLGNVTTEPLFQLTCLKNKYKYTRQSYITNYAAYLISMILIVLWQINYNHTDNLNIYLSHLPLFILITGLGLRFLAVIIYYFRLHYDLMNNRL